MPDLGPAGSQRPSAFLILVSPSEEVHRAPAATQSPKYHLTTGDTPSDSQAGACTDTSWRQGITAEVQFPACTSLWQRADAKEELLRGRSNAAGQIYLPQAGPGGARRQQSTSCSLLSEGPSLCPAPPEVGC